MTRLPYDWDLLRDRAIMWRQVANDSRPQIQAALSRGMLDANREIVVHLAKQMIPGINPERIDQLLNGDVEVEVWIRQEQQRAESLEPHSEL